MLTVAMAFAACYGVLQLAVLGWPSRSVGIGTLLLAVGVGTYGAGMIAIFLELGYTRAVAAITGDPLFEVVETAGQTVDPFIEEVVKVVPLLLVGLHARTRRQWGLTDYLLVGAGIGAGFGLLEAVMRHSHLAGEAAGWSGGWVLVFGLVSFYIPGLSTTLTSWLPAPVSGEGFGVLAVGPDTYRHLAWSALAGFGIGVLLRTRGPLRLLGIVPLLLVGADHAAYNFNVDVDTESGFGDAVTAPFVAAQPVLWLWPLLALIAAVALDQWLLRRGLARRPELRLAAERDHDPVTRLIALPRYASRRLPWTGLLTVRFVRMRRAALFGGARPGTGEEMIREVAEVRSRMDATDSSGAWRGRGLGDLLRPTGASGPAGWLRRFWPLLVWAALFMPPLVYFGLGTTPGAAGAQNPFRSAVLFPVIAVLSGLGLVWILWSLAATVRAVPAAIRRPDASVLAGIELRLMLGSGTVAFGGFVLAMWLAGAGPADPLSSDTHVLDALSDLLLAAGVVLVLASFVYFPPFGLAALATGGTVIVPTITTGFVTLGTLGVTSILLSEAVGPGPPSSGSGGGGGQPPQGVPERPPRPRPPVQHGRLRNIVDSLWRGTTNPNRIGDGTTMDAVRNERLTRLPTEGVFHSDKARQSINALSNWLRRYGPEASPADQEWARRLRSELRDALRVEPP